MNWAHTIAKEVISKLEALERFEFHAEFHASVASFDPSTGRYHFVDRGEPEELIYGEANALAHVEQCVTTRDARSRALVDFARPPTEDQFARMCIAYLRAGHRFGDGDREGESWTTYDADRDRYVYHEVHHNTPDYIYTHEREPEEFERFVRRWARGYRSEEFSARVANRKLEPVFKQFGVDSIAEWCAAQEE